MRIKIPNLKTVSESNTHEHWRVKADRVKEQHGKVHLYLKNANIPKSPWIVTLTRIAPRKLDSENMQSAFKAIVDAVSDILCGEVYSKTGKRLIGRNDSDDRIKWLYAQETGDIKEYSVIVEIQGALP